MQLKKMRQKENARAAAGKGVGGVASYSKGAAKREEILVGVMKALADGKLRNPPLRAIGQALGVEPAHILYYFSSREELLQSVIMRWDDDVRTQCGAVSADSPISLDEYSDAIARNITRPGIVHLYLTFAAEAVDIAHPAHAFFCKRFDDVRHSIAEAVRKEQAEGTIEPGLDAEHQARLLIALADGLQLQSLVDPKVDAASDLASAIARLRARSANS